MSASGSSSSLEARMKAMENRYERLATENSRLASRIQQVEESRDSTTMRQVTNRPDNVIRVVNDHGQENFPLQQAVQDQEQAFETLKQTVDSWNDEEYQQPQQEEQQEISEVEVQNDHDNGLRDQLPNDPNDDESTLSSQVNPPPGLLSDSDIGSASTIIVTLEMPLFRGSKRLFVHDAHLFAIRR